MTPDTTLEADISAWIDQEITGDGRVMAEAIDEPGIDARLAAYLAGLGYRKVVPDTVTLALRWADDEDGDPSLWVGPLKAGYVYSYSLCNGDEGWQAVCAIGKRHPDFESPSKEAAVDWLQVAVLKALAE
jgi:hypothetical protein